MDNRGHFLKLTDMQGKPMFIRSDAVKMVTKSDETGTTVCYGNDLCFLVKEEIEDVLKLLGGFFMLDIDSVEEKKNDDKLL